MKTLLKKIQERIAPEKLRHLFNIINLAKAATAITDTLGVTKDAGRVLVNLDIATAVLHDFYKREDDDYERVEITGRCRLIHWAACFTRSRSNGVERRKEPFSVSLSCSHARETYKASISVGYGHQCLLMPLSHWVGRHNPLWLAYGSACEIEF